MHNSSYIKICIGILFILLLNPLFSQEIILLSGRWGFKIDMNDIGVTEKWYQKKLTDIVHLPGSLQESGFGDDVSSQTKWLGGPIDNFFKNPKYKPYRKDDNFKFPFWLTPAKYYRGVAWYQKEISIPAEWTGKPVELKLERCHWATKVYFDSKLLGSDSSLSAPHVYCINPFYIPGRHTITVRVDNRYLIDVGENAHSVSDQTQGSWNGIIGRITLSVKPDFFINNVEIYPDVKNKKTRVHVFVQNTTGKVQKGEVSLQAVLYYPEAGEELSVISAGYNSKDGNEVIVDYPMGENPSLWDEFNPNLYKMKVALQSNNKKSVQMVDTDFGMREFRAEGSRFVINDQFIFLRGTLECAIFPETGYPPMDTVEWARIFRTIKLHGLNHVRFHSWCPPEAAFIAADKAGIYLQVEVCAWTKLGHGSSVDSFLYKESSRIIREYGNHPSFCMMVPSNEPGGDKQMVSYVTKFVNYWKSKDTRRLYSAGSGWPSIPENDYNITPEPRIQHWGEGLKSIINAQPPNTLFNYDTIISTVDKPTVSHETGQWCAYPDFDEINKYTGFYKPKNFEIFWDFFAENHMQKQAKDFLMASGKLQYLCYKQDIEAILRTQGMAGFQLLDLHDFPGQGTALVGVLDAFWDSKPYSTPEKYSRFCNTTVPLALIEKFVWKNSEIFRTQLMVTHYGQTDLKNAEINWKITGSDQRIISKGNFFTDLTLGNNSIRGIEQTLTTFKSAEKLNLEIAINGKYSNDWDFWVYPEILPDFQPENVIITDTLTTDISMKLFNGASVLLLLNNKIKANKGSNIKTGFSTVFWNTEYTNNQAPHTLGILCNPVSNLFKNFPTEYYTNMQWWDIITYSQPMILNDFSPNLIPSIQLIDTWFEARKLGILFESKVGKGKIIVTSIDFKNNINERFATHQLYYSLLKYMDSEDFDPSVQVELGLIKGLYE